MISLIIFDCDGVLVDSERIGNEVLRDCLAGAGIELSFDEVVSHFKGLSLRDCARTIRSGSRR